jgi:hypothetical protein
MLAFRKRFYSRVLIKFEGEFMCARLLRSATGRELIIGVEGVLSGPPCKMYHVKGTGASAIVTISFKPISFLPSYLPYFDFPFYFFPPFSFTWFLYFFFFFSTVLPSVHKLFRIYSFHYFYLLPLSLFLVFFRSFFLSFTLIYSLSSLSYDRSTASSKASFPHSAIRSFLPQMRVSSPFFKAIQ